MKILDRLCAGSLFVLAVVECVLVPKAHPGSFWILGTDLALLFAAMLNVLRIRNGYVMQGLKMFCVTANVTTLVFVIAVMATIGQVSTLRNPQLLLVGGLLLVETAFSLGKNA